VAVDDPHARRDLRTITAALERLQRYLTTLGHPIFERTDVHLAGRRCDGGPMDRGPGLGATSDHRICLYLGRPGFPHDALAGRVAGHEAVHALQHELGCVGTDAAVPDWLVEGMADDLATRALAPLDDAAVRSVAAVVLRHSRAPRDGLRAYERYASARAYPEAFVAALLLDAGRPRRQLDFCQEAGRGVPWQTAFTDSFRVSPDAFYRRFERLRARLHRRAA
jgi:hypothetical protein